MKSCVGRKARGACAGLGKGCFYGAVAGVAVAGVAVAVPARGAGPEGQRLVMLLQSHKQTITWVCNSCGHG